MLTNLEELSMLDGVSGNEDAVRKYICNIIKDKCEYHIDNLGNVIAFKKGNKRPKNKLMLAAHMDEVGLIVTDVADDGTLKISSVGGVEPGVVIGRRVTVGKNKIKGVIGAKAVHNLTAEEKSKAVTMESLYVDIGTVKRFESFDVLERGDIISFVSEYICFGEDKIKGKALDDRIGCAIMLDLINSSLEYDTWFAFTVQEEIGLRGARTAAFAVQPDFAIVLEATTAADIAGVSGEKRVCALGGGAVVSFMDRSTMYDRELYKLAFDTAAESDIKCQTKTVVAGGNDSGAIHISGSGIRTLAISAPCRYLHSPSCVVQRSDLLACEMLASLLMPKVCCL